MVIRLADNIYSPLGRTTADNYRAVVDGHSAMRQYRLPDGSLYTASLFPEAERHDDGEYTFFEQLCIASASDAIARARIDPASPRVQFLLSTTKGNVHLLAEGDTERATPSYSATLISRHFGNPNPPIVVSNACISGVSAQIIAMRSIEAGLCDIAVVIGCDMQSEFIISGFQCLHALSPDPCRPFDKERCGLNLGEAAATIIYSGRQTADRGQWAIAGGAMCNDANHISGPSRTGEGSYRCLQALGIDPGEAAFISVHGTSTLYNDEMESIAIDRAGLSDVPIFSLKGTFGHTMGAAGVLETILSIQAVEHGIVYGTRGFAEMGVSRKVNISPCHRTTDRHSFVKLMSGFGGCNAAILLKQQCDCHSVSKPQCPDVSRSRDYTVSTIHITPSKVVLNGKELPHSEHGAAMLTELYRTHVDEYPKYFKMDPLCRVSFVASELLLKAGKHEDCAVLLFNRSASLADDTAFQATLGHGADWYPSPALFVYTLPNIATGEIAIRNHFQTETNFMVLDSLRPDIIGQQAALAAQHEDVLTGWVECTDADHFEAVLLTVPRHTPAQEITTNIKKFHFDSEAENYKHKYINKKTSWKSSYSN